MAKSTLNSPELDGLAYLSVHAFRKRLTVSSVDLTFLEVASSFNWIPSWIILEFSELVDVRTTPVLPQVDFRTAHQTALAIVRGRAEAK